MESAIYASIFGIIYITIAYMVLTAGATSSNLNKPGPGLPDNIIELIKPIYKRLSADTFSSKCLDGKMQNQSELLSGKIWTRLPKSIFVGANVHKLGIYDVVAHFNIGATAAIEIFKEQACTPGYFFEIGMSKANQKHVKQRAHYPKRTRKQPRGSEHGHMRTIIEIIQYIANTILLVKC